MRRFIICTNSGGGLVNGLTTHQRNAITLFLKFSGWDTWHWFEDLWLVLIPEGHPMTPAAMRRAISGMVGGTKHVIVMELDGDVTYSGMGPQKGWPWMAEKWGKPE
jgi:hypothetical protein